MKLQDIQIRRTGRHTCTDRHIIVQ